MSSASVAGAGQSQLTRCNGDGKQGQFSQSFELVPSEAWMLEKVRHEAGGDGQNEVDKVMFGDRLQGGSDKEDGPMFAEARRQLKLLHRRQRPGTAAQAQRTNDDSVANGRRAFRGKKQKVDGQWRGPAVGEGAY